MATIKEDFVSFEVAKLLKEKGFQQLQDNCGYFTTEMVYSINTDDNGEHHFAHQYPACVCNRDKYIAAPTLQMAMKWLREKNNIHIGINPISEKGYNATIYDVADFDDYGIISDTEFFFHVEEACEAAIKYCLENLI